MFFVDMSKAFDKVRLSDVRKQLHNRRINPRPLQSENGCDNRIIEKLPQDPGYKMGTTFFNIIWCAGDAVLISDLEDNLKRLFNTKVKQKNFTINIEKTKCMTTSKESIRCKLKLEGRIL